MRWDSFASANLRKFQCCGWKSASGKPWIRRREPSRHDRPCCPCAPFETKPSTNPCPSSAPRSEMKSHCFPPRKNEMSDKGNSGRDLDTVQRAMRNVLLKLIPLYVFF